MWNQGGHNDGYGDHGGGYLNTSTFGNSQQGSTQKQRVRSRAESVIPVTIAQIMKADHVDEKFVLDGIDLHQVTVVGLVHSVKASATNVVFEIDDMTGPLLEARLFADSSDDNPHSDRDFFRENIYVRLHGHIRTFNGKRNLTAFKIVPLTDMNELTSHILEVVYTHAHLTKGHAAGDRGSTSHAGSSVATDGSRSLFEGGHVDLGLSPQQQQVLNIISSTMDDQGVALSVVCERLKGMPLKVVREAVEFLSSEGHIYSTIDDEHYRATDINNA